MDLGWGTDLRLGRGHARGHFHGVGRGCLGNEEQRVLMKLAPRCFKTLGVLAERELGGK